MFRTFLKACVVTLSFLAITTPAFAACSQFTLSVTGIKPNSPLVAVDPRQLWKTVLACGQQVQGQQVQDQLAQPRVSQAGAAGGTYVAFDVPGDFNGPLPTAINNAGVVTGYYFDPTGTHSFLRTPDGKITRFDPPAGLGASQATAINAAGVITGFYADASGNTHGYVRATDGTFTTIDVPGALGYTSPAAIGPAGTLTGNYCDATACHGFVRSPNGIFTAFDPPGSVYAAPGSINQSGAITGFYSAPINVIHGFVRSAGGIIVMFDAPVVGHLEPFPAPTINARGTITGSYCDQNCDNWHSILRAPDGTLTTIDAPGDNVSTITVGINSSGVVAGWYIPADFSAQHGFLRTNQGTFITFDNPEPVWISTMPAALNDSGAVTGTTCDINSNCLGFVWTPHP